MELRLCLLSSNRRYSAGYGRIPQLIAGAVVLLVIYSKSARESIPAHVSKQIVEEMGHATS